MSISTRSHRQDVDNILQNSTSFLIPLFLSVHSLHFYMPNPPENQLKNTYNKALKNIAVKCIRGTV